MSTPIVSLTLHCHILYRFGPPGDCLLTISTCVITPTSCSCSRSWYGRHSSGRQRRVCRVQCDKGSSKALSDRKSPCAGRGYDISVGMSGSFYVINAFSWRQIVYLCVRRFVRHFRIFVGVWLVWFDVNWWLLTRVGQLFIASIVLSDRPGIISLLFP